ncbi:MAG: indolepyruvate oxidoreductase subunit beta family protein [Gammaproteobacteria bacterium]|nr:indolepyruvate oxidoreductase subunit beta family protein [Gammaproteobacteria bacterium]
MSDTTSAQIRPITLTIAALGGQGGGVLADWLVQIAEAQGYLAQSTSVPGVAQRTGATIYYLEFFPRAAAEAAGREPVMALMPVPGDVDCVVASELAEAGRALQRGLIDPARTTVIASSHRTYAIAEKSAMGQGIADAQALSKLLSEQAKRLVLFDMNELAERHHSVISSVVLGAICGSGVLPFSHGAFEQAVRASGIAVETNLAAFEDAVRVARGEPAPARPAASDSPAALPLLPECAATPALEPLLATLRALPSSVQPFALAGVRRALDYQDRAYAALYLRRLARIVALEAGQDSGSWALSEATARSLALWMTFEDTIRVADLKTRATRFARVRTEVRAGAEQIVGVTEFVHPRVQEIADSLPAGLGGWILRSPRVAARLARFARGRRIRTSTLSGFLLLYMLAGLRRWRRATLRYRTEDGRIETWLATLERLVPEHRPLAIELARAQRLIKGYGETHERGWRSFSLLFAHIDALATRPDGAAALARLHTAALSDEDGVALAKAFTELGLQGAAPA